MSKAERVANRYVKKYGITGASSGRFERLLDVTSTGILSLDHALGTGGWPEGCIIEVFGPPDIGKSSVIAFNGMKEAQKKGKLCAIVALEPGFDPSWAEKNGVNIDELVIGWPDDGQEAFDYLYDYVMDDDIGFIVFDSIGAVLRPAEAGDKGKPSQGGQSALITWGVKRVQMPAWKKKKTVILLNQIRDVMSAHTIPGMVESPGGHALKHTAEIRVQLKPGKDRFAVKVGTGDDRHDVQAGRSVVAIIKRSKRDEGTNKRAVFNHYSMETNDYPFGVDKLQDTFNTAKRLGVIKRGGAWYYHEAFPDGKIQSEEGVKKWLAEEAHHEARMEIIRQDVLATLKSKTNAAETTEPNEGEDGED